MATRHFSFTLISANDLPDVRIFGRMKVYAEVSVRNTKIKWTTSVDEVNGTNPNFNTIFKFVVLQSSIENDQNCILDVQLYCKRTLGDDKHVGQVNVALKWLYENPQSSPLSMSVKVGDFTSTQGTIEFSYEFGDLETPNVSEKQGQSEKHEQSYVEEFVEKTAMALAVEGGKRVVLAMLGA